VVIAPNEYSNADLPSGSALRVQYKQAQIPASRACSRVIDRAQRPMMGAKANRNRCSRLMYRASAKIRSLMKASPMTWKMTVTTINGRLHAQLPFQASASFMVES
jgi:hypothetical protein